MRHRRLIFLQKLADLFGSDRTTVDHRDHLGKVRADRLLSFSNRVGRVEMLERQRIDLLVREFDRKHPEHSR